MRRVLLDNHYDSILSNNREKDMLHELIGAVTQQKVDKFR